MLQLDVAQLSPYSTIGDLYCHDFHVDAQTIGQVVALRFKTQPDLPGVLVTSGSDFLGMISKQKFLEKMSQPYSLELYLKRPIKALLDIIKNQYLQLSHTSRIDFAATMALSRAPDLLYEPIIVVNEDKKLRLLNIHTLLVAQSEILAFLNNSAQQQKLASQQYAEKLEKEKEKVKKYAQMLEAKQNEIQKRNRILEKQQTELVAQERQIYALNQRLLEISQTLYVESKRAFKSTFESVKAIGHSTDKILYTGNALAKELATVDAATKLIEKISKQVMHLGVQAAVFANQDSGQISSFSKVVNEISKLGGQTFEASNKVNQIANRFKIRIQELTEAASTGETKFKTAIQQIKRAEVALDHLEQLMNEQTSDSEQLSDIEIDIQKNTSLQLKALNNIGCS
ncbi:MAG: chemotaxis protein [Aphanothece sp. CMT-3BRIN-NPC111]|nr:chemotaxis protein [Aphanothece sp. CMT-3BRIN-NPC111]